MPDIGTLLREHYDAVAPAIDVDRLADRLAAEEDPVIVRPRWQGPLVAFGVACLLLLLIGGFALLAPLIGGEPPVTEPSTTTVPVLEWELRLLTEGDVQTTGFNPSLAVGPDGNPVVAYLGRTAERGPEGEPVTAPKVVACADPACASSTVNTLDEGFWPTMMLRPNGLPVVAAISFNSVPERISERVLEKRDGVDLTWCLDLSCSERDTETIGQGEILWGPPAVAGGPDGSVVVAYWRLDDHYLYVVSCGNSSCAGAEPARVDAVADADGARWFVNNVALAVLPDGRPVAAFPQANGELRYIECLDISCSQATARTISDSLLETVTATIAVRPDGLPVLAYYADGQLEVASCHDTSCTVFEIASLGAAARWTDSATPSISILPDGRPLVAFWAADGVLALAECLDTSCSSSTVIVIAEDLGSHDLAVGPDGSTVMVYHSESEMEPPPRSDPERWLPMTDLRFARCLSGTCTGG